MERTRTNNKLSTQMVRRTKVKKPEEEKEYDGNFGTVISTGSTLLNLAISGGRIRGGGLPGGILVEAFGPSGSGKTVLLSEIAGAVERQGGEVRFDDPEARLNAQFAKIFGFEITDTNYAKPDKVTEVFQGVRAWKPKPIQEGLIHGTFADSLAALSTTMEMDKDDGDPYGMRRAKEFSEELRKTCRVIADNNYLMVCSNQVREVIGATQYQEKTSTPGGKAMGFYSSLRLQFSNPTKLKLDKEIAGKKQVRIIGVEVTISVYKSSIWKPYRAAPVTILFDYGIDDIRQNLQYIKDNTTNTVYTIGGEKLNVSIDKSISLIEQRGLEDVLKEEVIDLWEDIESKFAQNRKPKIR
jgi:RecA/RadA recombinase